MGLVEKSINPKSKRYGNLGRWSPKDLAKTHENEGLEWAEMPEEIKRAMMPKGIKWAKEAPKGWNGSRKPKIAWVQAQR